MKVRDPVCGLRLEVDKVAAYEDFGGWVYFFCSTECARRFAASPHRYAVEPARAAAGGHAERTAPAGGPPATAD